MTDKGAGGLATGTSAAYTKKNQPMDKNLRLLFFLAFAGAMFCQTESVSLRVVFIVSAAILGPIVVYRAVVSTTNSKETGDPASRLQDRQTQPVNKE